MINNKKEFLVLGGIVAAVMIGYHLFTTHAKEAAERDGDRAAAKAEIRRRALAEQNDPGTPSDIVPRKSGRFVGGVQALLNGEIFGDVPEKKVEFNRPAAASQRYSSAQAPMKTGRAQARKAAPEAQPATTHQREDIGNFYKEAVH